MALATATPDGRPSVRIVLLRGYDERGFAFFTNYESRKGRELAANPLAALVFHWHDLERQVRIEGRVERVSAEESDAYFQSRPAGSRLGAWASRQSEVIPDREVLEARMPRARAAVSRRPDSPPRPLGRLPRHPRDHRVLARPSQPAARPAAVHGRRMGLADRAAVALRRSPRPSTIDATPAPGVQTTRLSTRGSSPGSSGDAWANASLRVDHEEGRRMLTRLRGIGLVFTAFLAAASARPGR